jgi:hypothetical protein
MRRIYTLTLASLALLVFGGCSTSQLAQQNVDNDDVYGSVVKAKELPKYEKKEPSYRTDEELYGGNDYSDEEYQGEYADRIDRFYYNRPWNSFYDSYYSYRYDPWFDYYGYNSFYRPGISFNIGFGSPWGYYGYNPYYSRYWGPYSYYNSYPGYGYGGFYPGYGYGGYYPGNVYSRRDYRSRPNRETNLGRGITGGYYPGTNRGTVGSRSSTGRPDRSTPSSVGGRTSTRPSSGTGATSTRPTRTEQVRPPRESSAPREQSRPTYSRPERSTPSSSGSSSGGRSSSGGSSSGSSGGSRPSRGGR